MVESLNKAFLTLCQHIIERQQSFPGATGQFTWLLGGITLSTRIIESNVRRAGLLQVLGSTGEKNVQGEVVQKLDRIANETIQSCLGYRGNVAIMVSEEDDGPRVVKGEGEHGARYIVLFDPLDGSSNIEVDAPVGTIFSILATRDDVKHADGPLPHVLQPGVNQVAAGYVVYGSSTVLAYTTGHGVHMFTLDPEIGAYVLHRENVRMPATGRIYSVNESNVRSFPSGIRRYLEWVKTDEAGPYTSRYIGSFVADFHRTLLRGGVFLYPPTAKNPDGKLRLMYEANPMAFLAEQAGGMASDGRQRIMKKVPTSLHERTPLIIGSASEVDRVLGYLHDSD